MTRPRRSNSPITSLSQKILLVFFGLFICLLILETGLRLAGGAMLMMQEIKNRIALSKKHSFVILCIGESTTRDQYPGFLKEQLEQGVAGIKVSVIDKGLAGAKTWLIIDQMEKNLNQYHPDMVICMMGANDSGDHIPYDCSYGKVTADVFKQLKTYKLSGLILLHLKHKLRSLTKCQNLPSKKGYAAEGPKAKPASYAERARQLLDQKEYAKARELFQKALRTQPTIPVYLGLAWSCCMLEDQAHAKRYFKQALRIDPRNGEAARALGWIYFDAPEELDTAEKYFIRSLEADPNQIPVLLGLGRIYLHKNKPGLAEKCFLDAIGVDPKETKAYAYLISIYRKNGDYALMTKYTDVLDRLKLEGDKSMTIGNYHRLKSMLDSRGIKLIAVQYPMRSLLPLKMIFGPQERKNIIFVDNEGLFKDAVSKDGYNAYFTDIFAGDFGHCTEKGNRLLAQNIADTIIREYFKK